MWAHGAGVVYIGLDFLVDKALKLYLVEVNLGLPGGAQEIDLTHSVRRGAPSGVFARIETCSLRMYGMAFRDYLHSLPFMASLKPFKLWLDGEGPFPTDIHPALRLEDKAVQHRILAPFAPVPESLVADPEDPSGAAEFLRRRGRLVLKRRLGRGGRGLAVIDNPDDLAAAIDKISRPYGGLLQEYVESKAGPFTFSVRAVAFGGEFIGMYANLARRSVSNHGVLACVEEGPGRALAADEFETVRFNQKSWEAEIWFGGAEPAYLRHNLYEDEVARTALRLPAAVLEEIEALSVRVERFYEGLDLAALPLAWFEQARP
jgi:hypothetical protein